jgi:hypothetical protein
MKKLSILILAAVLMGSVARAAQVGDTVFAFVGVENRVPLAVSTDAQEVTHFVLDDGIWLVSGQVNFLSLATPAGTMFTAANISVGSLSFDPPQTASVTAEQVARLGNIITQLWFPAQSTCPMGRTCIWSLACLILTQTYRFGAS